MTQIRIVQRMLDGRQYSASKEMSIDVAVVEIMARASKMNGIARPSECGTAYEIVVDGKTVETYHIE